MFWLRSFTYLCYSAGHVVMYRFAVFLINLLINILIYNEVVSMKRHPFCGKSQGFANHRQPKTLFSRHGRIINGIESNPNAWPWQVSFFACQLININFSVMIQEIHQVYLVK